MNRQHLSVMCACLFMLALGGCSEPTSKPDGRRALLRDLGTYVIVPMHQDLATTSEALHVAAVAFCETPTTETFERVQRAWSDSRKPLKYVEVFGFGPYAEEPQRFGPKLDFHPSRPASIESLLAESSPITASDVGQRGAAQRGSTTVEYLLFAKSGEVEPFAAFAQESRRCDYLVAATRDYATQAGLLRDAWVPEQGNYLGALVNAGDDTRAFADVGMAVAELANRMVFMVENIRKDKINRPLNQGTPQPELVESRFADRSVQDIIDNLDAVRAIFTGDYNTGQHEGFQDVLSAQGRDFQAPFEEAYQASVTALRAIPGPLVTAIETHPTEVKAAYEALREFQRLIQTEILSALGIPSTFNDNDGD